jgi:hypothetical protein
MEKERKVSRPHHRPSFTGPGYFHSRPPTGTGYDPTLSSARTLAPTNKSLIDRVKAMSKGPAENPEFPAGRLGHGFRLSPILTFRRFSRVQILASLARHLTPAIFKSCSQAHDGTPIELRVNRHRSWLNSI